MEANGLGVAITVVAEIGVGGNAGVAGDSCPFDFSECLNLSSFGEVAKEGDRIDIHLALALVIPELGVPAETLLVVVVVVVKRAGVAGVAGE